MDFRVQIQFVTFVRSSSLVSAADVQVLYILVINLSIFIY